jgi:hypothetical protein
VQNYSGKKQWEINCGFLEEDIFKDYFDCLIPKLLSPGKRDR